MCYFNYLSQIFKLLSQFLLFLMFFSLNPNEKLLTAGSVLTLSALFSFSVCFFFSECFTCCAELKLHTVS